jgi:hypothetical protein
VNREQLAAEASRQYSQIRCYDGVRSDWEERSFHPAPTQRGSYALQRIKFENLRDSETKRMTSLLSLGNSAARAFYQEHQAELYEMAREEMEADGVPFSFADRREEVVYRYGEDVAELHDRSPLDALGAMAVQIAEKHKRLAVEALAEV